MVYQSDSNKFKTALIFSALILVAGCGGENNTEAEVLCSMSGSTSLLDSGGSAGASGSSAADLNQPVVQLFQHCNYEGWMVELPAGHFNQSQLTQLGALNNDASSIKISEGYVINLYEHDHLSGTSVELKNDQTCLVNSSFNDRLTSLSIVKESKPAFIGTAQACFYDLPDFKGGEECVSSGEYQNLYAWDDKVSSVRLKDGYTLDLFTNSNFNGQKVTLTADIASLETVQINNTASSFRLMSNRNVCGIGEACDLKPDITQISVTNPQGQHILKGEQGVITLTLDPETYAGKSGRFEVTPYLTSKRFSDYQNVKLDTVVAEINPCWTPEISITIPTFISDLTTGKRYALGRGEYEINKIVLKNGNGEIFADEEFTGKDFTVNASKAVFPVVIYNEKYFAAQGYSGKAKDYVESVYTRPSALFNENDQSYVYHDGGFDEMMNMQHMSSPMPGMPENPGMGHCEHATAQIAILLGLENGRSWGLNANNHFQGARTSLNHHGFDTAVALDGNWGGGVACGWINVQVSGLINTDRDRQQVVMIHETGHVLGAPHCDPKQGYVMCSGEMHEKYQQEGKFVWHQDSKDRMTATFD